MTERPAPRKIIKVRVKNTPIRYDGKKYFQNDTLEIQDNEFNNELHEFIEEISNFDPQNAMQKNLEIFAVRNISNISINKDQNTSFAPGEKFYVLSTAFNPEYMEKLTEVNYNSNLSYADYYDMIHGIIRPE